eukprot:COSAG01_NODE_13557_length_1567_cov_38.071526_2_plen_93_part_00
MGDPPQAGQTQAPVTMKVEEQVQPGDLMSPEEERQLQSPGEQTANPDKRACEAVLVHPKKKSKKKSPKKQHVFSVLCRGDWTPCTYDVQSLL